MSTIYLKANQIPKEQNAVSDPVGLYSVFFSGRWWWCRRVPPPCSASTWSCLHFPTARWRPTSLTQRRVKTSWGQRSVFPHPAWNWTTLFFFFSSTHGGLNPVWNPVTPSKSSGPNPPHTWQVQRRPTCLNSEISKAYNFGNWTIPILALSLKRGFFFSPLYWIHSL